MWMPAALYIPKTTEGAKLDAAKKFVAFVASPEGCDVADQGGRADRARTWSRAASCPADVPQVVKDMQPYFDKPGTSTPALEFLSPIKGPALEQITVEVGSGIATGQGRRRALRRGRQEAGPAARAARLVTRPRRRASIPPVALAGPDRRHLRRCTAWRRTLHPTTRAGSRPPATRIRAGSAEAAQVRTRYWFYLPAAVIFVVLFVVPTFASFYFSLTRWTLFDIEFIGLDNFGQFFQEPALRRGPDHT